jgi:hypothetical protein
LERLKPGVFTQATTSGYIARQNEVLQLIEVNKMKLTRIELPLETLGGFAKTKLLSVCFLTLAAIPLSSQVAKHRRAIHTQEKSAIHVAPQAIPEGLKNIYSNLGKKNDLYLDTDGWSITGFNSFGGSSAAYAIALPFTPKSNSHVSQVRVAVQYYGLGANQVNLTIYSDSGGIPGTPLAGPVTVTNLPGYGTCCTLAIASFTPLAVAAGTKYWVVADTPVSGPGSDFVGVWDFVSANLEFGGTNGNDGWVAEIADTEPAGQVLGTLP